MTHDDATVCVPLTFDPRWCNRVRAVVQAHHNVPGSKRRQFDRADGTDTAEDRVPAGLLRVYGFELGVRCLGYLQEQSKMAAGGSGSGAAAGHSAAEVNLMMTQPKPLQTQTLRYEHLNL